MYLIQEEGGTINYMKLIKLMYMADRKRLLRRGRPITFDVYCSLDYGPILSRTLNLITHGAAPGVNSFWMKCISAPKDFMVSIAEEDFPTDSLSEAEVSAIKETYNELGHFDEWELVDWTHKNLEEWQDPEGSSIRIEYHDILIRGGEKPKRKLSRLRKNFPLLAMPRGCSIYKCRYRLESPSAQAMNTTT